MRESSLLEFKERVSNTFLKTVSAFANYGGGEIKFGIRDDGTTAGVQNASAVMLQIENMINDSIEPNPNYSLHLQEETQVITLSVLEGLDKPYFYKSKAYKRHDTATIEVDRLELMRLILSGQRRNYEDLPARTSKLTFTVLEKALQQEVGITSLSEDVLRTLELKNSNINSSYNIAGELLADQNTFCGIDLVLYGDSINIIADRENYEHVSVLTQYEQANAMYRKYYQYEEVSGALRQCKAKIPAEAFREAVANALAHRAWEIDTAVKVMMYPDRIEILSPGGLPHGVSEAEYLAGQLSILRNPILGNVLYRLHIIERLGSGVARIKATYKNAIRQPQFFFYDNSLKVVLPVIVSNKALSPLEILILGKIKGREMSTTELTKEVGRSKTTVIKILHTLVDTGYVQIKGTGRGTKYLAL